MIELDEVEEKLDLPMIKILAFLLSLISGSVLFLWGGIGAGLFGFFIFFGRPVAALALLAIPLFAIFVIVGSILIARGDGTLGGSVVIVFSSLSIISGFSIWIPVGVTGGFLGMSQEIRDVEKDKLIVLVVVFTLCSMAFSGGLLYYRRLSSEYEYLEVNGTERKYLIEVPSDISEEVPLLLALHGGGGSAVSFRRNTDFDVLAEEEGFIVVYPDGSGRHEHHLHTWNTGITDTYADRQGVEDVKFLSLLIDELTDRYEIDGSSIYMIGHSNGGKMTYRFASEHPEKLAGIAPSSCSLGVREEEDAPPTTVPEPPEPLSVIHIHGKEDKTVPYHGGEGRSIRGTRYDISVNESVMFWVEHNDCDKEPMIEEDREIEVKRYLGGEDDTQVSLVTLNEAGHFWPDMDKNVRASEAYHGLEELIWHELKRC